MSELIVALDVQTRQEAVEKVHSLYNFYYHPY